jgi:hypothetical protein
MVFQLTHTSWKWKNGVLINKHTFWRWRGDVSINTYLLEMNMWCFDWHITFGCEHVSFILFLFIYFHFSSNLIFIHNGCSTMYIWWNIPPCHEILNAMCQQYIPKKIQSCSPIHTHVYMLTKLQSPPNSHP